MLSIRNLDLTASNESGTRHILKGIDLDVPDGSFTVLTGPNGGGKTTLAKAIMGIMPADSGSILWDGRDITALGVTERARMGISYAFQQPPRFKGIRVRDLLVLASGKEDLSTADCCRYLNKVGLCAGDYIDREVDSSLSGGEVKRIEIATVLARDSRLMIFDEPEAGIDLWSFSRLTATFGEIRKNSGATVIVISHQERIISLADTIAVVADGRITMCGPRDELFPAVLAGAAPGCRFISGANEGGDCE
jgi:Fe-S cluster assembly ATP-binding protein